MTPGPEADQGTGSGRSRALWWALGVVVATTALRLAFVNAGDGHIRWADEATHLLGGLRVGTDPKPWGQTHSSLIYYFIFALDAAYFVVLRALGGVSSATDFAVRFFVDAGPFIALARVGIVLVTAGVLGATFLLGRRLFDALTGALAAALLSVNVLFLNMAIYAKEDMLLAAAVVGVLLFSARPLAGGASGARWPFVGAGALSGVAAAAKLTGGAVILVPLWVAWRCFRRGQPLVWPILILVGASALTFAVLNPFAVLDPASVFEALDTLSSSYTSTFAADRPAAWYYLTLHGPNVLSWPGMMLVALGLGLALRHHPERATLLILYPLVLLLALGARRWYSVAHYFLPALPALAVLLAHGAVDGARALGSRLPTPELRSGGRIALGALVALVALYMGRDGAGYLRILAAPDTREEAADWIREHVPREATLLSEGDFFGVPVWGVLLPSDPDHFATDPLASTLDSGSTVRALQLQAARITGSGWRTRPIRSLSVEALESRSDYVLTVGYRPLAGPEISGAVGGGEAVPAPAARTLSRRYEVVARFSPTEALTRFWPHLTSRDFDLLRRAAFQAGLVVGPEVTVHRRREGVPPP